MGKRCPPGVICIENMTIFMLVVSLLVVMYLMNTYNMNLLARTQPTGPAPTITTSVFFIFIVLACTVTLNTK